MRIILLNFYFLFYLCSKLQRQSVCVYVFAPLNAANQQTEVAVTLNLMRTVFYFILFVFNFGLMSAFYMGLSLHCTVAFVVYIHTHVHMYVCAYLFSFYGHIALSFAEGSLVFSF